MRSTEWLHQYVGFAATKRALINDTLVAGARIPDAPLLARARARSLTSAGDGLIGRAQAPASSALTSQFPRHRAHGRRHRSIGRADARSRATAADARRSRWTGSAGPFLDGHESGSPGVAAQDPPADHQSTANRYLVLATPPTRQGVRRLTPCTSRTSSTPSSSGVSSPRTPGIPAPRRRAASTRASWSSTPQVAIGTGQACTCRLPRRRGGQHPVDEISFGEASAAGRA